jgi:hypothetical protein
MPVEGQNCQEGADGSEQVGTRGGCAGANEATRNCRRMKGKRAAAIDLGKGIGKDG